MNLDQASNSSLSKSSFQPFDSLPDEVLLLLLDPLTPFQRCLILSICKKWNHAILQRKSWWQHLDIPYHLPFSTALSILRTFNSRSNFTLEHVLLQPLLTSPQEVDEVFAELKKSSEHVKLLFLNQSGFMLTARRAARKFLPKLNTFYCTYCKYSPEAIQDLELMWVERDSAEILDNEEKGLQFLHVAWLEQLEPADLEWFSKLKCLSVEQTDSVKDLHAILDVSKRTLTRLRLQHWKFNRDLEGPDLIHADGYKRINLPNLTTIFIPASESSAAALSTLLDVGGQESRWFIGFVHSLLHFDFPSLSTVLVCLYEGTHLDYFGLDEEQSKLKTTLFLERNPSILHLGLERAPSAELQDRENLHLNFILQSLTATKSNESSGEPEKEPQSLLLPKLRKLAIYNPKSLDKKLLKQVWETRKAIQVEFQIYVCVEGRTLSIDRSRGEEWLDEAES